ncbi:unnamed protein product, partial [Polarella glacialis]
PFLVAAPQRRLPLSGARGEASDQQQPWFGLRAVKSGGVAGAGGLVGFLAAGWCPPGKLRARLVVPFGRRRAVISPGPAPAPSFLSSPALSQVGLILSFMGFQATLNLYMKFIMSRVIIAPGLFGIPASFLVTGLQQLAALLLFVAFLVSRRAMVSSSRRRLTWREAWLVFVMGAVFSANMGLNNFSLAFIPLSVNQVIRACTPLATAILQSVLGQMRDTSRMEWFYMVLGVACAASTVVARAEGKLALGG